MKVVAQPIQMIAWFEENGTPHPIRFRFTNKEQYQTVIKVDKVVTIEKEKLAGNPMYVFTCQSSIDNILKIYELKYELHTCKWMLYKI